MTQASRYRGLPVSEGVSTGQLHQGDLRAAARPATPDEVAEAFAAVAQERSVLAQQLRASGRGEEADIVGIGALIAADPALVDPAVTAAREGADAATAVERSADAQAAMLAALPSPELAARADDVRQVANAVLAHLAGGGTAPPPPGDFILVRREVDPADLIRLAEAGLAGVVSVSGGASSHAAIIARGLGLPMLAGADPDVLAAPGGHPAILDAVQGRLTVDPSPQELAAVAAAAGTGSAAQQRLAAAAGTGGAGSAAQQGLAGANGAPSSGGRESAAPAPAFPRTTDGEEITLLCNVASATETRLGLAAGATGVGLLRTEIPFIGATGWPSEADHRRALDPVLGLLTGRPAVVRLLDFSGDKIPPFLAGRQTGLAALLGHPRALGDQLRAVLHSGAGTQLGVMVPMVSTPGELAQVRGALAQAATETGTSLPELGMMVELTAAATQAAAFTRVSDFFSIGTNDLTSEVLGLDRADPRMSPALAADPRVLKLISEVVRAARDAGVSVSVCGDAAADPAVLPLLIGLGVRKISVGPARLVQVAAWIERADSSVCAAVARDVLRSGTSETATQPPTIQPSAGQEPAGQPPAGQERVQAP
jgi:phosphoenolpyruvate-protein kinase (PTS system EI component)